MKYFNESGRSMIEMLGVLAIIGVLSVGGIAGYRQAMDSYHASQTVDRLMKRAMVVSSQKLLGQEADISSFTQDGVYEIPNAIDNSVNGKFGITVNTVPQKVCEKIKSYDWKLPVIIPGTCTETNDMTFTFNNDLSNNNGNGGSSEEGGSSGEGGSGTEEGGGDSGTPEETKTPQQLCEESVDRVWCDNACYNAVFYIAAINDETRMYSDNGTCACHEEDAAELWNHKCVDTNHTAMCDMILENCPYPIDGGGCYIEPEMELFEEFDELDGSEKRELLHGCGFYQDPMIAVEDDENALYYCPSGKILNYDTECISCTAGTYYNIAREECLKCPGATFESNCDGGCIYICTIK